MSDPQAVSQLAPAGALTGEELVYIVQGGVSKRVAVNDLVSSSALPPVAYTFADSPVSMAAPQVAFVDATGGNVTVRLPPLDGETLQTTRIKRTDETGNTVTAVPAEADDEATVDGAESQDIPPLAAFEFQNDGTNWWVTAAVLNNTFTA